MKTTWSKMDWILLNGVRKTYLIIFYFLFLDLLKVVLEVLFLRHVWLHLFLSGKKITIDGYFMVYKSVSVE